MRMTLLFCIEGGLEGNRRIGDVCVARDLALSPAQTKERNLMFGLLAGPSTPVELTSTTAAVIVLSAGE